MLLSYWLIIFMLSYDRNHRRRKPKLFIIIFSSVQRKKTAGRLAGRLALHPQNLLREHHPRHRRRRRQVQARRPGKDDKTYLHIWPGLIFLVNAPAYYEIGP
jgi:hypothetical protein